MDKSENKVKKLMVGDVVISNVGGKPRPTILINVGVENCFGIPLTTSPTQDDIEYKPLNKSRFMTKKGYIVCSIVRVSTSWAKRSYIYSLNNPTMVRTIKKLVLEQISKL